MAFKILNVVEEQVTVRFTGKINILASENRQFLGHILFLNGEVLQVKFLQDLGLKAFYRLIIQENNHKSFDYVVEPEIVSENEKQIHFPYAMLKTKLEGVIKLYETSQKFKPPGNLRLIVDPGFLSDSIEVTSEEFDLLSALTEWSKVDDVYQHCDLLDHEITWGLVSLRKKNALKVVGERVGP